MTSRGCVVLTAPVCVSKQVGRITYRSFPTVLALTPEHRHVIARLALTHPGPLAELRLSHSASSPRPASDRGRSASFVNRTHYTQPASLDAARVNNIFKEVHMHVE